MWFLLLVSTFGEFVIFRLSVLAVLDLYCEQFSSHLRRLISSILFVGFMLSLP